MSIPLKKISRSTTPAPYQQPSSGSDNATSATAGKDSVKFIRRANITDPNEDYDYYYYYYYDYIYPDDDDVDGKVVEHLPKPSYFSSEKKAPERRLVKRPKAKLKRRRKGTEKPEEKPDGKSGSATRTLAK